MRRVGGDELPMCLQYKTLPGAGFLRHDKAIDIGGGGVGKNVEMRDQSISMFIN